jgi:hypothetical protein
MRFHADAQRQRPKGCNRPDGKLALSRESPSEGKAYDGQHPGGRLGHAAGRSWYAEAKVALPGEEIAAVGIAVVVGVGESIQAEVVSAMLAIK